MRQRIAGAGYRFYGHLPAVVRRWLARRTTPSYTVGALCAILDDGDLLLVRHSYRPYWGVPGGLVRRGESPEDAAVREVREEIGVTVELDGASTAIVLPRLRRVDVAFRCGLAAGVDRSSIRPTSAEIVEVDWFPVGRLPTMHGDSVEAIRRLAVGGQPATSSNVDRRSLGTQG